MDHTRDNPLKRFTAFWIALLLVFSFAVALLLLRPLTHHDSESTGDLIREQRLEVKRQIDRDQKEALNGESLQKAIAAQIQSFGNNPVEKGNRMVPAAAPEPAQAADADQKSSETE
jgi:hypothetical protein